MDKNKIPENLRPITDHMVEYDPAKHDLYKDALLVYIDREAFEDRGYEIEDGVGGMLGFINRHHFRPLGKPDAMRLFAVGMEGHVLVFEHEDAEDAENRKRIEALENAPIGSLAVWYPDYGAKVFVRKEGNGDWRTANYAKISPDTDNIRLFEDDAKDVIPEVIDSLDILADLMDDRGNSLACFHFEDRDGDMWRYDPKGNRWSWNQHFHSGGWSGWHTATTPRFYLPLTRKPIN